MRLQVEQLEPRDCPAVPVSNWGAIASDGIDDTVGLRAAFREAPVTETLVFTDGAYQVSATVPMEFGPGKGGRRPVARAEGAGDTATLIVGSFAGPLFAYNAPAANITGGVVLSDIGFRNQHAQGIGLQLEQVQGVRLERLRFEFCGDTGLLLNRYLRTAWDVSIRDITCIGDLTRFPAAVGVDVSCGQVLLEGISGTQLGTGASLGGTVSLRGGRFEVCEVAILLGNRRGFTGSVEGLGIEACGIGLDMTKHALNVVLQSINLLGDLRHVPGQPSRWPTFGLVTRPGSGALTVIGSIFGGNFEVAAVKLGGRGPVVVIASAAGSGGLATSGSTLGWDVQMDPSRITWIGVSPDP